MKTKVSRKTMVTLKLSMMNLLKFSVISKVNISLFVSIFENYMLGLERAFFFHFIESLNSNSDSYL